jgi:hypothetical protein
MFLQTKGLIMKPKHRQLLERCLEDGIEYGWRRAHKHEEKPTEDAIKNEILHAISIELHEWFNFEEDK